MLTPDFLLQVAVSAAAGVGAYVAIRVDLALLKYRMDSVEKRINFLKGE